MTTPPNENRDRRWMRAALALARRGLGRVSPNPAVGCILVLPGDVDRVVGRGWTQPGGRPHAETEALTRAGTAARGATAYVTLEPCSHTGETAPCADALIAADISSAVIAIEDPDPRVAGRGIERLRAAGVEVRTGCLADEARRVNAGFLSRVERGRPWVALKTATTLDGKIATRTGHSRWITGDAARARGHLLRARFDAVLTGMGTVVTDNPQLTCRLPGLEDRSPLRVVIGGGREMPPEAELAGSAETIPTWLYLPEGGGGEDAKPAGRGLVIRTVGAGPDGRPDAASVLGDLAENGITRLLVEAGAQVNSAFLRGDLVDEVHWFRSSTVMGADGLAAVGNLGHDEVDALAVFDLVEQTIMGADSYQVLERRRERHGT